MQIKWTTHSVAVAFTSATVLFATGCSRPGQQDNAPLVLAATTQKPTAAVAANPLKNAYFGEQHLHTGCQGHGC
jgi:hypothetical protein